MIYLILGVLLVFNSYSAIENIVEPRVSMNQTPLKGMLVGRDQNSGYQKTNRLLKSLTNKKVDYVCPDGLFHVVTGKYQPDNYNPWFTEVSSTSLKNPNLVVCIQNKDWIPKYIIQNYTLIAEITDKTSWSHWSSSNILYFRKK